MAIGVTAVVMIVSGLRRMWRSERLSQDGGVVEDVGGHRPGPPVVGVRVGVVADDREEDVLEGRLLLDVLDLGGREQRP